LITRDESVNMHVMPTVLMQSGRDPSAFRAKPSFEGYSTGGDVLRGVLQFQSMKPDDFDRPIGRRSERTRSDSSTSSFPRGPIPDASDTFM